MSNEACGLKPTRLWQGGWVLALPLWKRGSWRGILCSLERQSRQRNPPRSPLFQREEAKSPPSSRLDSSVKKAVFAEVWHLVEEL